MKPTFLALLVAIAGGCGARTESFTDLELRCAAQDARPGTLRCYNGNMSWWDGHQCLLAAYCNCNGRDCRRIYSTRQACEEDHADCPH